MNRRSFTRKCASCSFAAGLLLAGLTVNVPASQAQEYRFNPEHRRPVENTLHDLRAIAESSPADRHAHERYENAIRHLSQFGERLHERGQFDKDRLDEAIEDVQNVADHNPMREGARATLRRDADQLRMLRQHYDDRQYRYR